MAANPHPSPDASPSGVVAVTPEMRRAGGIALDDARESQGYSSEEIAEAVYGVMTTLAPVTPGMVEAGIKAVRAHEYELWESRWPEELAALVSAIYQAMRLQDGSTKGV